MKGRSVNRYARLAAKRGILGPAGRETFFDSSLSFQRREGDETDMGKLLRRIVIWPIPPAYSTQAVATVVLAAIIVALAQVRSFPGVLATLLSGFVAVCAIRSLKRRRAD